MSEHRAGSTAVTEQNRQAVAAAFARFVEGDQQPFFDMVHDDVRWTVIGSTEISGTFESKRAFLAGATSRLFAALAGPLHGKVNSVLADGDHVIVQWASSAPTKSGGRYEQTYCWVMRVHDGLVVETTAYLDTEMVTAALS